MGDLSELADKIEGLSRPDNSLDVLAEIALFKPDGEYASVRANDAGTKVIYTTSSGKQVTCWAYEWTHGDRRDATVRELRAQSHSLGR